MNDLKIRKAEEKDITEINDIINYYIINSKVILDLAPTSYEYRKNGY